MNKKALAYTIGVVLGLLISFLGILLMFGLKMALLTFVLTFLLVPIGGIIYVIYLLINHLLPVKTREESQKSNMEKLIEEQIKIIKELKEQL